MSCANRSPHFSCTEMTDQGSISFALRVDVCLVRNVQCFVYSYCCKSRSTRIKPPRVQIFTETLDPRSVGFVRIADTMARRCRTGVVANILLVPRWPPSQFTDAARTNLGYWVRRMRDEARRTKTSLDVLRTKYAVLSARGEAGAGPLRFLGANPSFSRQYRSEIIARLSPTYECPSRLVSTVEA